MKGGVFIVKPLKLTMTAFGPYKDKEMIDFSELKDNSLFVISGNTGAGKTTIFDGICFALYGTASGQDRQNNAMLRSDFADDDTHTSVELEFELNGKIYRILRQLGHVKQGNKTKTGEKYEFFETDHGKEVPCVDRQIVSEIDKKVETLMGLTQDQFKQIVMLPQGEFRKLLTSETENKEDILRRLFKTEPYKQISELLRSKKDRIDETFKQERQTRDTYVQNISAMLPNREGSLVFQVLSEDYYNINQVINGLEEEVIFYENQIKVDQEKYEKAYAAHDKKQTTFHHAKVLNERFEELNQKKILLQELNDQVPGFKSKEKQFADAEIAGKIEPYEKQRDESRLEEERKTKELHGAEIAKRTADDTFKNMELVYREEESKKDDREKVGKKLDRLKEYLPVVKEIDVRKKHLHKLETREKEALKVLNAKQTDLTEKKKQSETYRTMIKTMDEAVSQLPDKDRKLTEMRNKVKVLFDYKKLKENQEALEKDLEVKKQEWNKRKIAYTELENSWLNNQASMLASHLHNGEACPVCGSHEHPQMATDQAGSVTKEQLETVKQAFNEADEHYRNTIAKLNINKPQLEEKENDVTAYSISLEEASSVASQLVGDGKELKAEVDKLDASKEELAKLKETYEKTTKKCEQMEAEVVKHEQAHQQLKTEFKADRAVYQDRLQNIPEAVRVLSELEKQIKEAGTLKEKMGQALEAAQKKFDQAKEAQTKATANLEHAKRHLDETKAKCEQVKAQFAMAISKAGFTSEETYQRAKLLENDQLTLKKEIEQFNQRLSTISQQVQELQISLKDKQKVDLTLIQQELEEFKQAYETALNKRDQSKKHYQEAATLIKNIGYANKKVSTAEKQLSTITDLYDVIRGQNSRKVSFERYLQIEYLEQIIESANHRLRRLSNGQFLLMRSDRQESHGRQSGLGLDVNDAYTGQTRDVKTLSGGEKFNASLCLALGMSDVIQSFQGNISIKTMFIDEGFGSLDEESLHKSIETLIDLQKSGRMIGVISHVQELKTIFPAVLEVKKTKEGYSRTRFISS